MPKTIILAQVINHATEHRTQIMVILTQLGIQPPDLDSWSYFDELEQEYSLDFSFALVQHFKTMARGTIE